MKQVAEISSHSLVRNSDTYMLSGVEIDPDQEFSWIDKSYKQDQQKFQLTY